MKKKTKIKLSIIIPSLNELVHLPRLLSAIEKQKLENIEVVVANSGRFKKIREIAKKHNAQVADCGIKGPGHARNVGAKKATGEILLFLDADVKLSKNFLKKSLNEFEKRNLDIAGVYATPISDKIIDKITWEFYNVGLFLLQFIRAEASGFCIMCRKKIHDKIKGFDEGITYREDADYVTRASKATKTARFGLLKPRILISMRRFEKEGRLKMLLKYLELTSVGMFKKIKGDVGYGFGKYKEDKKK